MHGQLLKMKLLLCLCLVTYIVGVHGEDIPNIAEKEKLVNHNVIDCAAENKVDLKTLKDVEKSRVIPSTPEMQCYLACLMKKEGMMNPDGTFTKNFGEEKDGQACKNLSGKDACEIAFRTIECFAKAQSIEVSHKSE